MSAEAEEILRLNWKAIAAMSLNRVIGHQGKIPWHLPEDFRWVKECTSGQVIAMGRKTLESMGRPLPNRTNIVLSRKVFSHPGCIHLHSLEELEQFQTDKTVWIFGGSEIYRQALPKTAEIYLTVVNKEVEGDAFFPPFEEMFDRLDNIKETKEFEIRHYRNRKLG